MNAPKFLKDLCGYMFEHYSKDGGKLLVHMGAAGWLLSSAAQISMLVFDKKIDKKQKKFLIPQEAADAGVNFLMYYTICEAIKRTSDWFVEKGKILTDDVARSILRLKRAGKPAVDMKDWKSLFTPEELKQGLGKILLDPKKLSLSAGASQKEIARLEKASAKALEKFSNHKNNMGIYAAITASVIACNVVTPIVRNKLASMYQKHALKKEAIETRKEQITNNITQRNPLPSSFNKFNNYNSFGQIKL